LYVAKVASMPYFIAFIKMLKNGIIQVTVSIGYQTYTNHLIVD
jgi:hypothetical protein